MDSFFPAELIKKKRRGQAHSKEEIQYLIQAFSKGELPDYQMSAWAMAVFYQGLNSHETSWLTQAMLHSGQRFDFSSLHRPRIDKHSTGGVGDKTSLILGPIVACADIAVPMIPGRGLGHTGGTLDKLESIPGFNLSLSIEEFYQQIDQINVAFLGKAEGICVADRKLYALRDVTGTVESKELIAASIMSKKLAEDLTGLVFDIKHGSGAFMKSEQESKDLANLLIDIGSQNGVKVSALITNMNQPLGRYIGNALEVKECVDILTGSSPSPDHNRFYDNTRELSLQLAAHMILLGEKASNLETAYQKASEILRSGQALEKWTQLCKAQGHGDWEHLPEASHTQKVIAPHSGVLCQMNTEGIGVASMILGAGRHQISDPVDPSAGIEMQVMVGDKVKSGETLAVLHSNDPRTFDPAQNRLLQALTISDQEKTKPLSLIDQVICYEQKKGA